MSYCLNQVTLIGRVGKDAEVKEIKSGVKVANFSLATSMGGYKKADGTEVPQSTQWHNIQCWQGLASLAEKAVKKGSIVSVVGMITYREYESKEGVKKTVTEISASDVIILSGAQEKNEEKPQNTPQKPKEVAKPISNSNDLPF